MSPQSERELENAQMNEIWIIGTDPPCPRCALMGKRVERFVQRYRMDVTVYHLSYDDPRILTFGRLLGRIVGTAKHVAQVAGIQVDLEEITRIMAIQTLKVAKEKGCRPDEVEPSDQWSPELDQILKPCQDVASSSNYIMTPVLVVDGQILWQGNVPTEERIAGLLNSLI